VKKIFYSLISIFFFSTFCFCMQEEGKGQGQLERVTFRQVAKRGFREVRHQFSDDIRNGVKFDRHDGEGCNCQDKNNCNCRVLVFNSKYFQIHKRSVYDFNTILGLILSMDLNFKIKKIVLRNCELEDVPQNIFGFKDLVELDVSYNNLKYLSEIQNFRNKAILVDARNNTFEFENYLRSNEISQAQGFRIII